MPKPCQSSSGWMLSKRCMPSTLLARIRTARLPAACEASSAALMAAESALSAVGALLSVGMPQEPN